MVWNIANHKQVLISFGVRMGNYCLRCITRITVKDASTMTEGVPLLSLEERASRNELRSRVQYLLLFSFRFGDVPDPKDH